MPTDSRDAQFSPLPPPGFAQDAISTRRVKIVELLQEIINYAQRDPEFFERNSKQTDLLVTVAEFVVSPVPTSNESRQCLVQNLLAIGQELLAEDSVQTSPVKENPSTILKPPDLDISPVDDKTTVSTVTAHQPVSSNDDDSFSLDDLASEYLQDVPALSSSADDKPVSPLTTPSSGSGETELNLDDLANIYTSPPPTNVFTALVQQTPLESILFSSRLSSHDAAEDAESIWKESCSPFGQMLCTKLTVEIKTVTTKQSHSSCLFDRSLYERLTRLVDLLPKQCIRNSVQQRSIRHNAQQPRRPPPRGPADNPRPLHRPPNPRPNHPHDPSMRFPHPSHPRPHPPYPNHYNNQQGNPGGYFVDRRSQPNPNRHPAASLMPTGGNYSQRNGPRNNAPSGEQNKPQQNKKPPPNNHNPSNQGNTTVPKTSSGS